MPKSTTIRIFVALLLVTGVCAGYLYWTSVEIPSTKLQITNKTQAPNNKDAQSDTTDSSATATPSLRMTGKIINSATKLTPPNTVSQDDNQTTASHKFPAQGGSAFGGNNLTIQQFYTATLTINTTTYPLAPSTSIYDAMRLLQIDSRQPFTFSAKEYSGIGMFVEEINGVKNDIGANLYWILYVNGKSSQVGASDYLIKEGDKIEWKYEKAKF